MRVVMQHIPLETHNINNKKSITEIVNTQVMVTSADTHIEHLPQR